MVLRSAPDCAKIRFRSVSSEIDKMQRDLTEVLYRASYLKCDGKSQYNLTIGH